MKYNTETEKPDYILYNGNFITMQDSTHRCCAVGIRDGVIVSVWEQDAEVPKRFFGTKYMNLRGRTVLPGFIDSNVHMVQGGLMQYCLEIYSDTKEEFLDILKKRTLEFEEGELIWCIGYDEENMEISRWDLDQVSSVHPIVLSRTEFHKTVVNTTAYNLLKIPGSVPGILRNEKGIPTGVLQGEASGFARRKVYTCFVTDEMRSRAAADMEKLSFQNGITSLNAMEGGAFFSDRDIGAVRQYAEQSALDIFLFPQTMDVNKVRAMKLPRIGGNIYLDGSIGSQTAAMYENYVNQKSQGVLYFSQEDVNQFVLDAHRNGLQIALSCIGPRAAEQALNAFEAAFRQVGSRNHRHRLELFVLPSPEQIERAISLGLIFSMRPNYDYYWGGNDGTYAKYIGNQWQYTNPIGEIVRRGGIVCGGSEYGVTPLNPLQAVQACVRHQNEAQQISLYEALKIYTCNGAYANFMEHSAGMIRKGMYADFTVLEKDPFQIPEDEISQIGLEMTFKAGRIVYSREEEVWK